MTAASSESDERLNHSAAGLFRLSQLEGARFHIYVEGKNADRFYYSRVLEEVKYALNLTVEFHLSKEIPGAGEGKLRCLDYYAFLRDADKLVAELEGECTITCFLLDKDVDDILGTTVTSDHIVYTSMNCVENHIVRESIVPDALAAATGSDVAVARRAIHDQEAWLSHCCDLWKEWVALCLLAKRTGCGVRNYKSQSLVNDPLNHPAQTNLIRAYVKIIATKLALPETEVEKLYLQELQVVADHAIQDARDSLFKGKWYSVFIAEVGKSITGTGSIDEKMLWAALSSQVNPAHSGSDCFRTAIRNLAQLCQ